MRVSLPPKRFASVAVRHRNYFRSSTLTIKKIKLAVISTTLCLGVSHTQASVLENLAEVANSALPSYGRTDAPGQRIDLSNREIDQALRELLTIACHNVADRLARYGYNNASVRIDLPKNWRKARKTASRIGYRSEFDKLEKRFAEIAVAVAPTTRDLLIEMIADFDIDDPVALVSGNDTGATLELRAQVAERLAERLQPVVSQLLNSSGAIGVSDQIVRHVKHLTALKLVETEFTNHLIDESLDGYFHYLALEERAIRLHPLHQNSNALRRVFG